MSMSKAERRRAAATGAKNALALRATSLADVGGILAGNFLSGRVTSLRRAGPFTVNQLIGSGSLILKFFKPFRVNPLLSGLSTTGVAMGGTDLFQFGFKKRAEAAIAQAQAAALAAGQTVPAEEP